MKILPTKHQQGLIATAQAAMVPPPRRPDPEKTEKVKQQELRQIPAPEPPDGQYIGRHLDLKV